jgi:hypothetical protein
MDELTAERFGSRVPWVERSRRPIPLVAEIERRHRVVRTGLGDGGPDTREAVWRRRRILLGLPTDDIGEAA